MAGADLIVRGHAHGGKEQGVTAGGIRVRNVAEPVVRSPYRVFCMPGMECAEHTPVQPSAP